MMEHLRRASAFGAGLLGALCAATGGPALSAEATATGAPPNLNLSAPGVVWTGFIFSTRETDPAKLRLFNDYAGPATGIGPVTDDPAHPYANNRVAGQLHIQPTYRVADLNNAAANNLMPWVREALARQNALVLQGRNGEPREPRCWETGVPAFHLNPGAMHIIQTPKEVVLFLVGRVRHIWLNPTSPTGCDFHDFRGV
jgi:hypothetical protein